MASLLDSDKNTHGAGPVAADARVRDHFANAGAAWGTRYHRTPQRMSDLDLLLRRRSVHRLLEPVLEAASDRLRLLDVGCGAGTVLDGVPRDRLAVLGADFTFEMLLSAAQAHPRDRFVVADAGCLPIAPASVDLVTCIGVLEYVPDPAAVLRGIRDVLRPGGALIVSFPNRVSLFRRVSEVAAAWENALLKRLDAVRGKTVRPVEALPYRHTRWTVAEARRLLDAAGFDVREVAMNTYGTWGRFGRLRFSLRTSEWLSNHLYRPSPVLSALACTMVIRSLRR